MQLGYLNFTTNFQCKITRHGSLVGWLENRIFTWSQRILPKPKYQFQSGICVLTLSDLAVTTLVQVILILNRKLLRTS